MAIKTRQVGPCFAAEVEGVDLGQPLSADDAAAIHAGMDQYAVLVFHDQRIDDEQQLAFTRSLGDIERNRLPCTIDAFATAANAHGGVARNSRFRRSSASKRSGTINDRRATADSNSS